MDTQGGMKGGVPIGKRNRRVDRHLAPLIGFADHLAGFQTTAEQGRAESRRLMTAPSAAVELLIICPSIIVPFGKITLRP